MLPSYRAPAPVQLDLSAPPGSAPEWTSAPACRTLMPMTLRCPMCRAPVLEEGNPAFPFCSSRCRLLDLGNWLGEEYRIPAAEEDEGDGASGPAPQPESEPRPPKARS
jgi:endogenous inhibitor of DNA gyrase (YacG/DUF329 family)